MRQENRPSSRGQFRPDGTPLGSSTGLRPITNPSQIPPTQNPQPLQPMQRPKPMGSPSPIPMPTQNRPMPIQSNSIWNRPPMNQPQGIPFQGIPFGENPNQIPPVGGFVPGRPQMTRPQNMQNDDALFSQAINKVKGSW